MKEFGDHMEDKLIRDLSEGKTGKLNGDNLDIRVRTNDIRMNNRDKDYHFFASSFIIDRVDVTTYSVAPPEIGMDIGKVLTSAEEKGTYRNGLKVVLSRIMVEHLPGFSWMANVFPKHLEHPFSKEMALRSTMHVLPVSLNNEVAYEGCVRIMDEYVQMINRWFAKAGRGDELEALRVPVGGDQLTRVRLQGAKALRAGTHTTQQRLDQLFPVIVELFHTQQDFLEKACKRFLKLDKSRDKGTLGHLKMAIQRVNVNGQVKSRFKAHDDFTKLVGKAYFLDYLMDFFKMEDIDDEPHHSDIPSNIKLVHKEKKAAVASSVMDKLLDSILNQFDMQDGEDPASKKMHIQVFYRNVMITDFVSAVTMDVCFDLSINVQVFTIKIAEGNLNIGCTVLPISGLPIMVRRVADKVDPVDDLSNYVLQYLQWYFIMIHLSDAIHEGDVIRTNVILKEMIPFFYSHSYLSKYFVECVDYILKTEVLLPPAIGMRVRAASFVSTHGGNGNNKPTDLQKENEVKMIKELIKGLGSNKTEQSIIAVSKAAPVMMDICANFDKMLQTPKHGTTHKKRPADEDLQTLLRTLKTVNIWGNACRTLHAFKGIARSPFKFDKTSFSVCCTEVARTPSETYRWFLMSMDCLIGIYSDTYSVYLGSTVKQLFI
ncbi:PREDICTED: LOW QUALITY PROTEIN: uncharacterized protein LOC106809250 [Priapulus caudatus]|uniref:LOW QUALITY PROTEIN: uncharacterized protein LOC106809250 n=1 Tax=Priapulus caudatus TaxID=37621 RepID=A0ABM1E6C2_PRICU|nr:PREDICTED: LOW QUALITY PROTEIN: uncharacterized protein LOC106809250 [Priapulus caudatus]